MAAMAPRQIMNEWTTDPREISGDVRRGDAGQSAPLLDLWRQLRHRRSEATARHIQAAGWTKRTIAEYLYERARRSPGGMGRGRQGLHRARPRRPYPCRARIAGSSLVVAAGGPPGGFGAVIPPWMGSKTKARNRRHRRLCRLRAAERLRRRSCRRVTGNTDRGARPMTIRVLDPTNETKVAGGQPAARPVVAPGQDRRLHLERQGGHQRLLRSPRAHAARGAGCRSCRLADEVELQRAGRRRHRRRAQAVACRRHRRRRLRELLIVQFARLDNRGAARRTGDRRHDGALRQRGRADVPCAGHAGLPLRHDRPPDQQRLG